MANTLSDSDVQGVVTSGRVCRAFAALETKPSQSAVEQVVRATLQAYIDRKSRRLHAKDGGEK